MQRYEATMCRVFAARYGKRGEEPLLLWLLYFVVKHDYRSGGKRLADCLYSHKHLRACVGDAEYCGVIIAHGGYKRSAREYAEQCGNVGGYAVEGYVISSVALRQIHIGQV